MKKKIIIIVSIILAITLATCIFAVSDSKEDLKPHPVLSEEDAGLYEINVNAVSAKKFITADNKEIALTYEKSMITQGESLDMYLNTVGEEFYFDKSGRIIGFMGSEDKLPSGLYDASKKYISEETAIRIAEEQAKSLYGEIFDGFEYDYSYLSSCGSIYYIFHNLKYGEDGFITGPACWSQVTNEGHVLVTMLKRYYETKDFDESLLDGITKTELQKFAKEQVQLVYGDTCKSFSPTSYTLVNNGDGYRIKINVSLKLLNADNAASYNSKTDSIFFELK